MVTWMAAAAEPKYRSVNVGEDEALHLLRTDRKEEIVRKENGQTGFAKWAVSPDRRMVGWLALYPNPFPSAETELPMAVVVFEDGRVIRRFTTEQMVWGWGFRSGEKRVAYCDGPTHGGASQCLLRDLETGRIIEKWNPKSAGRPPAWVVGLHY